MAWQLLGWIHLEPWEKDKLSEGEMELIKYHEQYHQKFHKLKPILSQQQMQKDDLEATAFAFEMMLEDGYEFWDLIEMELDYRFLKKYGLRYDQFREYLEKRLKI